MSSTRILPTPIFDSIEHLGVQAPPEGLSTPFCQDFSACCEFLLAYKESKATFNTYRRDVERLAQWSWLVAKTPILSLQRKHIEEFIAFCKSPPKAWIGLKRVSKFTNSNGTRAPNKDWRPFVATVKKSAYKDEVRPEKHNFELAPKSVKELLAVLSTFFSFLVLEEYRQNNPVQLIRQKGRLIRREQGLPKIRRLSLTQWNHVLSAAEEMAAEQPEFHERTLFVMAALYSMYLRISELVASEEWQPSMNNFARDENNSWWFEVLGKGNKLRRIAVSNDMIKALKRWRLHLGLSPLPSPADDFPLLPKVRGSGPMTDTSYIRKIVQQCFDNAVESLSAAGLEEEAGSLKDATVHWLRHTGISEDVRRRPREHVRDDAGHSSGAITDQYIDVELQERAKSARNKPIRA